MVKEKEIKQYVERFCKGIRSGPLKKGVLNQSYFKEAEKNNVYYGAVYQGYLDMCRTMSYSGKQNKEIVLGCLSNLAKKIKYFFEEKTATQDSKNYDLEFNDFLGVFDISNLTVGQRQKIINMAFKYLYCCTELPRKHFDYCHMPLDSYTLNWYKHRIDKKIGDLKWSSIDKEKNDKKVCYNDIVRNIRKELGEKKVLISEFEIWEQEKLIESLKALKNSLRTIKDDDSLSDEFKSGFPSFNDIGSEVEKIEGRLYNKTPN